MKSLKSKRSSQRNQSLSAWSSSKKDYIIIENDTVVISVDQVENTFSKKNIEQNFNN